MVVLLHGTDGLRQIHIGLAEDFAANGFIGVTGCWFEGSYFRGVTFPDSIACPGGPPFTGANLDAAQYVMAIVDAARGLPGARPDRAGLWGQSRGAIMTVLLASTGRDIQTAVACSASYTGIPAENRPWVRDTMPMSLAGNLRPPLLILHGTADDVAPVQQAREYERTLRDLTKTHQAVYYEGAPHVACMASPTRDDALRRAVEFFRKYLGQ